MAASRCSICKRRRFDAAQIFSVRKRLNNRSVVTPRIGVLGESQPSWRTTSYFADFTWRYRMYEDWLFAEVVPALEFPPGRQLPGPGLGGIAYRNVFLRNHQP